MASATDRCRAIAGLLEKKYPEFEFKTSTTMGAIAFLMIEVWRREPRGYIGSDIRSVASYGALTGPGAQEVVNSVKGIIKQLGSKRR